MQRVNGLVKLLRVPIRVLPLNELSFNDAVVLCNDTTEELTPANPFLEIRQKERPLDLALESLQVSTYYFLSHNCRIFLEYIIIEHNSKA